MADQYVVYEQETDQDTSDSTWRVLHIYGPYRSWEHANTLARRLQKASPHLWVGIRNMEKAQ